MENYVQKKKLGGSLICTLSLSNNWKSNVLCEIQKYIFVLTHILLIDSL